MYTDECPFVSKTGLLLNYTVKTAAYNKLKCYLQLGAQLKYSKCERTLRGFGDFLTSVY